MEFIIDNYLVIILVGLFFVFALIGYLIDILRKNKETEKEDIPETIKPVEIKDIELPKESLKDMVETNVETNSNDADDLLKNYEETISE